MKATTNHDKAARVYEDYLAGEGIELQGREDGVYLIARFEVDEAGPFDTTQEALVNAKAFRPCLEKGFTS